MLQDTVRMDKKKCFPVVFSEYTQNYLDCCVALQSLSEPVELLREMPSSVTHLVTEKFCEVEVLFPAGTLCTMKDSGGDVIGDSDIAHCSPDPCQFD